MFVGFAIIISDKQGHQTLVVAIDFCKLKNINKKKIYILEHKDKTINAGTFKKFKWIRDAKKYAKNIMIIPEE